MRSSIRRLAFLAAAGLFWWGLYYVDDQWGAGSKSRTSDLGEAAARGDVARLEEMLARGRPFTPGAVDWALGRAIKNGQLEALDVLLPHASRGGIRRALAVAASNGEVEAIELLLPRIGEGGVPWGALESAVVRGDLPVIEALLPRVGAGALERTLRKAASYGQVTVMERLLPWIEEEAALMGALTVAAREGTEEVVTFLVPHVKTTDPALEEAAAEGPPESITPLLPRASRESRTRALGRAVLSRNTPVVELLLEQGADPTAAHEDGTSYLRSAERRGDERIGMLLRQAAAKRKEEP